MRPYNSILSPRGVHNHYPAWRNYREYGGGMVTDWGAHHIDIVQWGLGMDESGPVGAVPAQKENATSGAKLLYDGGIEMLHGEGIGVHFFGSEGEVQVTRGRFALSKGGKFLAGNVGEGDGRNRNQELDKVEAEFLKDAKVKLYDSPGHLTDFLNCMGTRQRPITHEDIGGRSVIACHLLNLAYYHGEKIDWEPARAEFANGTGDPKWLTRNYRGSVDSLISNPKPDPTPAP